MNKEYNMLKLIRSFYELGLDAINKGASFFKIVDLPLRENIGRFKYTPEEDVDKGFDELMARLASELSDLAVKEGEEDA